MFGGEALLAAMTDAPAPASQLVRHVLSTVARHQGDTPPADDVTLLLVRWLPPGFAADLSIPNTLPGIGEARRCAGSNATPANWRSGATASRTCGWWPRTCW